jgi:hypothetical protein
VLGPLCTTPLSFRPNTPPCRISGVFGPGCRVRLSELSHLHESPAVLRALAAVLAGVNHMDWRRFLLANAAGAILWASAVGFSTYFFGGAVMHVTRLFGPGCRVPINPLPIQRQNLEFSPNGLHG